MSKPVNGEWRVDRLVPGGSGFLRLPSGQGAFVPGALPGERVLVLEAEDRGGYLNATHWNLLEASPNRVTPACPVQSRCGGCDLMTLDYTAQLQAKVGILRDALTRTGGLRSLPAIEFVPSPDELAYRTRIRLHVSSAGKLGFYVAKSRELVEIPACLVAHSELNQALETVRRIALEHASELAKISELELRVAAAGPRLSLHLIPRDPGVGLARSLVTALARSFQVSVAERAFDPERDQRFPLPQGMELRAPGGAFTQVNWAVNVKLVQEVMDGAERAGARHFCDLYCGAGNFSLPLFARGLTGLGIEASRPAIAAAQRSAQEHALSAARFIAGDVRIVLAGLPQATRFDLVVLDPPRAGARDLLPELIRRAPSQIAYCACDPVTLARDLRTLVGAGYALERVTGFDMFPQTHHFETLAWLSRYTQTS